MKWYDETTRSSKQALWAIVPDGSEKMVGTTGLHDIDPFTGSCTSGIIIADQTWWHKGVASRAHLARTWYAHMILNRRTIQSQVRVPNKASLKALESVGYIVTGKYLRNSYRNGVYFDTYVLSWINPYHVSELFPNPTDITKEYQHGIDVARERLAFAQTAVTFL
jgi:RimJ/RimL family protein N-acetyltransferase